MRSMSNIEYSYMCNELSALEGARLDKLYEIGHAEFRLRFRVPGKYEDLMLVLGERMHLTRFIKQAPQTPTNITMYLRKKLSGSRLLSVSQKGFDRVVVMQFKGTEQFSLVLEMFAKGNLLLLKDGIILRCYRREEWKDRVLRERERYSFPQSERLSPPFEEPAFSGALEPKPLMTILSSKTNFGNIYLEEACARAEVSPKATASELSKEELKSLLAALNNIHSSQKPLLYWDGVAPLTYSLTRLSKYSGKECRETSSLSEAIDICANSPVESIAPPAEGSGREKLEKRLEKQKEHYDSLILEARECKRRGDEIYARYSEVEELLGAIQEMRKHKKSWSEIKKALSGRCKIDEHSGQVAMA